MRVPVALWQLCELLYTYYLLTYVERLSWNAMPARYQLLPGVCLSVTSPSFVEATGRIEKIFDTEVCLDLSYTLCCKEFRVGTLSPKLFLDRIACVAGMTCRVDRIPACDGQTDGHLAIKCHAVCMHYI